VALKYKCRVCGNDLFEEPLLRYKNMPKQAQYLPDDETIKIDRGEDLDICQCLGCGLIQLSNEPVPYYREVIRAAGISEEMTKFRLKQFKDFIQKFSLEGKKILEVGCGQGEYLSIMKQCNVDTFGIEYKLQSVEFCTENGLNVEKEFIEDDKKSLKHAPFDGFFILNFLEHIPNLNSTLKGIYNNLKDDAVGIIEVPNFDMIYKNNLFSEFIGDHLFYFTKDTLATTLKLNGFEIIECKEVWHDYIISAYVKKRTKLNVTHFYDYQEKIKNDIHKYISAFGHKEVVIWGAGHQALAVISLTCLEDKIKYVVDSAQFKQGKYTPATHIPILSPEELKINPVQAIIIMAASYSDEVARIIRKEFSSNINVAVLRDFGLEVV
jgi:2-polyprenyl-3-methyl-5-hydroxy-6-metoxy-1,4-benzoquinol methylase